VQKDSKANISDTQTATFEFPELNVVWTHRTWGAAPDPEYPWAAFIYGDKGVLKADVHKYAFIPQGKKEPALSGKALIEHDKYPEDVNEKDLEQHVASAIRAHMKDFLAAIQNRSKPVADIEQGVTSSIASILANISMQVGRTLTWDNSKGEIVGDAEANKLLRRPYRAPWKHPEVASV
jgi:predicted dehydrogenase